MKEYNSILEYKGTVFVDKKTYKVVRIVISGPEGYCQVLFPLKPLKLKKRNKTKRHAKKV